MSTHRFDKPVHIRELKQINSDGSTNDLLEKINTHHTILQSAPENTTISSLVTRIQDLEDYINLLKTTYTIIEN